MRRQSWCAVCGEPIVWSRGRGWRHRVRFFAAIVDLDRVLSDAHNAVPR